MFQFVFFLCGVKRNLLQINKKSSTAFEKKNWRRKKSVFYKLKKKNYFREIRAKKFRSKMGNAKKGHNKTGRAKVDVPKRRASIALVFCYTLQALCNCRHRA